MSAWFNVFVSWLSSVAAAGADSWLQALAWMAALVAAGIGGLSLRRNSLQSRAALLLNLYKSWEDLAEPRRDLSKFLGSTQAAVLKKHKNLQSEHQKKHMRAAFTIKLSSLRDKRSPQFSRYLSCLAFFELLGMYVKNGYVPLRDVLQVYKGPVLELDIAWRDFIHTWQQQAHMPPGLLEHALFLMDMVRVRTERPVFYWTIYRFRRFW